MHPSFVGSSAIPKTVAKRRRTLCRMQENVDLSPLESKNLPLSRLRTAVFNIANPLPPPVTLTRRNLDQDFAVLLMRSGYQTVDDLDFVAMDRFQQEFFEIRSLAWEKWIKVNAGMRQGLLTDARYFDFISYAQMLTIQKFMREPFAVFEERFNVVDGQWDTRVVQRDIASLSTPHDILDSFRQHIGNKIYARMLNTVRYPAPVSDSDVRNVLNGIKEAYGYFQLAGFYFKLDFSCDVERGTCTVNMVAPAILWSAKALRQLRGIPNDYDVFAIQSFLRASNVSASVQTTISASSVMRQWFLV